MPASSAPPGGSGRPGIPSAAADAEAELARLEAERDRLQGELKALTESISTREAVEECVAARARRAREA